MTPRDCHNPPKKVVEVQLELGQGTFCPVGWLYSEMERRVSENLGPILLFPHLVLLVDETFGTERPMVATNRAGIYTYVCYFVIKFCFVKVWGIADFDSQCSEWEAR